MKYSFTCPAPNCGHTMEVEAQNDDEAISKLLVAGDEHGKEVHPNIPQMPEDQAKEMVRVGMRKTDQDVNKG